MGRNPDDAIAQLRSACSDVCRSGHDGVRVVNLYGPLGVGKTRALDVVARSGWDGRIPDLVIDGVDHERAVAAARREVERLGDGAFAVVAGRRPLSTDTAVPGPDRAVRIRAVPLRPWPASAIRVLAESCGVTGTDAIELVVTLAGGIPLIADTVARMLCAGIPPDAVGALADEAARMVVRRLTVEDVSEPSALLPVAAIAGPLDEELLTVLANAVPGSFDRLLAMSVVSPGQHGVAVAEPYRALFDLAYAWRHPIRHRALRARATAHRCAQPGAVDDAQGRAGLAEEVLCTSTDAEVRRTFFPVPRTPVAHDVRVRPASNADGDAIERMMYEWTWREGLDRRCVSHMFDLWLAQPVSGFDLLVDGDDRARGMVNLTGIGADTRPALERLLQQHTDSLIAPDGDGYPDRGGAVIGMMVVDGDEQALRATLLRHVVRTGVLNRRLVVSTSWGPYQELAVRIGLPRIGATQADAYGCGRTNDVFVKSFAGDALAAWLSAVSPAAGDAPATAPVYVADVRAALHVIRDAERLATSPLLASTTLRSAAELAAFLREEICALTTSGSAADADAGHALTAYYLRRVTGHDALARRLHLSRATYFRRLDHGLTRLTEAARWLAAAPDRITDDLNRNGDC